MPNISPTAVAEDLLHTLYVMAFVVEVRARYALILDTDCPFLARTHFRRVLDELRREGKR